MLLARWAPLLPLCGVSISQARPRPGSPEPPPAAEPQPAEGLSLLRHQRSGHMFLLVSGSQDLLPQTAQQTPRFPRWRGNKLQLKLLTHTELGNGLSKMISRCETRFL